MDQQYFALPRTFAMPKDRDIKTPPLSIEDTGLVKRRMGMGQSASRFDPYQGVMSAKRPSRKRDLRKVQEWLEAKRRAEALKRENEGNGGN
jgi:hypothetical protein